MSVKNDTESFINMLNKGCRSIEPWGTLACTFFAELKLLFICADYFRFFKGTLMQI